MNFSDDHLWFSIFSRPYPNKFTRVQRCTSCFVLLLLSMCLNILYYAQLEAIQTANSRKSVSIVGISVHFEEIVIGIITEVIALIPSLLIIQLFRRLRTREESAHEKTNKGITFAWWWIFIVYGFCFILVGISIVIILARGIEFGDVKSQQWLISNLGGFFSSIFLTQPIKVLSLILFFACFCRKSDDVNEVNEHFDNYQVHLNKDEAYVHSLKVRFISFSYFSEAKTNSLESLVQTIIYISTSLTYQSFN